MRVALAIFLNLLLALALGYWLRREHRLAGPSLRRWLLPTLALRLVAGVIQDGPDLQRINFLGRAYTEQFWAQPSAYWALLQSHQLREGGKMRILYQWSNTLFISKIAGMLNFASLGTSWLNGLYLSLGCFVACWGLVRTLTQRFPATPAGAGIVAFLLWPSIVWWTSGVTKETLLLGSGAALTMLVLNHLYGSGLLPPAPHQAARSHHWAPSAGRWLLVAGLAWLHLRMRYFFALPLLASLLALGGVAAAERRGWLRLGWGMQLVMLLVGLLAAGAAAVAIGGEPVSRDFVTSQLWLNYTHGIATSVGQPHVEYAHLQPTVASILAHAPLAAAQTITRPWLGEKAALPYLAAGLENLLLLGLLLLALFAVVQGRPGRLPAALVLALLLYCVVLAALIGLSTPNLGTLHRYRAVMLPWLLWLLLQNDYARKLLKW